MVTRPMFYVIDGHALAYRQFFALPVTNFSTRAGEPTNAIYGFARTLLDILQKDKPQYIAVSFDRGLSGREQLYGAYKGTREKMPGELVTQMQRINELVEAFNMPLLALDGYEADDVIGSIVPQAEAQGVQIRIVTGDRDILQLLSDQVTVQMPRRGEADVVYDTAKFQEEYGLEPWQLVEFKALVGDNSDNIPGVKGIGEKGATTLLQQYRTIDDLYAHIDEVKGATQRQLIEGRESAYLSKELATIRRNVPITLDLNACLAHDYDASKVDAVFAALEFRSLRDRLPRANMQLSFFDQPAVVEEPEPAPIEVPHVVNTITVQDEAGLEQLLETLSGAKMISFDTETTGIDQMSADLVGISLAVQGDTGYYIPVGHQTGTQVPIKTVINALRGPLTNPSIPKAAHNAGYDLVILQRYGIDVEPITFDTMIAEWLHSPEGKFLGLKNLARQTLNVQMTEISDLIGSGKKQITMDKVPITQAAPYAAADAAITLRLVEHLQKTLDDLELTDLFKRLEMPLIPVIAAIERAGVMLDTAYLAEFSERLAVMVSELEADVFRESESEPFNVNSPRQLNAILFEKLKLPVEGIRKTTHGYSTDAAVLESLIKAHPVIESILNYREVSKLKSTYVDALPLLINPTTGRVHTSYNQTGTTTGRISSSNPNLQNIPIRTGLGREVRRAFVAAPGMKLLSVDYSQVELRILAHISRDETLLEAFAQGQDIHAATAAAVYNIPISQVNKEQRNFAKRVNFGLIYGMGPYRLARDSNLTLAEARDFIRAYFDRLPGVERYLEETKRQARQGPIRTLLGRRREFAVLRTADQRSNQTIVQAEERVAINMPIQGTAADIMKQAMITVHEELAKHRLHGQMILQVHDELVLEVPENEVRETRDLVVRVMEGAYQLDAPLKANAQVGDNWRDMEGL
ncbi:MAG: DNA polymerase I [Anaerolineae bacterium]|nr:DNA polymerase I [Anaerolineae bacterium]